MHRRGAVVHMGRTSVTLDDETEAILDAEIAPNGPYESRSEAVRECIREYACLGCAQLVRRFDKLSTLTLARHRTATSSPSMFSLGETGLSLGSSRQAGK